MFECEMFSIALDDGEDIIQLMRGNSRRKTPDGFRPLSFPIIYSAVVI